MQVISTPPLWVILPQVWEKWQAKFSAKAEQTASNFLAGSGIRAKYLVYPTPTDTPAGCSGNRQSRSIGKDGDHAGDGTPRVPLYMNYLVLRFVIPFIRTFIFYNERGYSINLPHAILSCCNGGWRYGRHRIRANRIGVIQVYGI